jgi:4-hydroxy 2-oxovalerate aldolase
VKPTLLDCTLRDGGYYNSWDFSPELANSYLKTMEAVGLDHVELGFRSLQNNSYRGPFAFTTDSFLERLEIPATLGLSVMINAGEFLQAPEGCCAALGKVFAPAHASKVSMVRVAAHCREVHAIAEGLDWLGAQGYVTTLNLMQISSLSVAELQEVGRVASEHRVDILYLADSLGALAPDQVGGLVRTVRATWAGNLGFHAHDNLGNAMANTIRASQEGVGFLDGTLLGMGRGPGNARTEHLVLEFKGTDQPSGGLAALAKCLNTHFLPLQKKHGWGTNLYYYMAGKSGIHPTYVQQMMSDPRYRDEDILEVLHYLKAIKANSYNLVSLRAGRQDRLGGGKGEWCPAESIGGRETLILGPGPGAAVHREALEDYIRSRRPFVIALNTVETIAPELIDVRAACHPIRLMADCRTYGKFSQPVVTPVSLLPDDLREALPGAQLRDFGVSVRENQFEFQPTHCVIPSTLVMAYALAIATSGGTPRILLAGFDGYGQDDPRQLEVAEVFACYLNHAGAVPLVTITPSTYNLPACSVYGFC